MEAVVFGGWWHVPFVVHLDGRWLSAVDSDRSHVCDQHQQQQRQHLGRHRDGYWGEPGDGGTAPQDLSKEEGGAPVWGGDKETGTIDDSGEV